MSYKFQSCLYDTRNQMLDAMAYWFFTADGLNDAAQIDNMLNEDREMGLDPAEAAADEMISEMALDEPPVTPLDDEHSHMERNGYTREDLVEAARRFLRDRPDHED